MAEKKGSVQYRLKKKQDKFREKLFRLQGLDPVKPSRKDFVNSPQDEKTIEQLDQIIDDLGGDLHEVEIATIKIQSIQRSRKAKKELQQLKEAKMKEDKELSDAAAKIQSIQRSRKAKKDFQLRKEAKLKEDKELSDAAAKIQSIQRSRKAKNDLQKLKEAKEAKIKEDKELNDAAAKIQSIQRSRKAKKDFQQRKEDVLRNTPRVVKKNRNATQVLDEDTAARVIQKVYWHWIEEREYQLQLAEAAAKAKKLNTQKVVQVKPVKEKQRSQSDYIEGMLKRKEEKAQRDEMRQRKFATNPVVFKAKPYKRPQVEVTAENNTVNVPVKQRKNDIMKEVIKVPSHRADPVRNSNFITRTTERHRQALAKHEEERFNEKLHAMLVIDKKRLKQYESVLDNIENEKTLISKLTSRVDSTMTNSWDVVGKLGALANASYLPETDEYDEAFNPNIDENNVITRLGSALERIKHILAPDEVSTSNKAAPLPAPSNDVKRSLQYEKVDLTRNEYGPVSTSHDLELQNRLKSYKLSEGEKTEDLKLFNSLDNVCRQAMAEIHLYDDVINSMLSNRVKKPISPPRESVVHNSSASVVRTQVSEQVEKFLQYPKYEPVTHRSSDNTSVQLSKHSLGDDVKLMDPKYLRDSQINYNNEKERDQVEKLRSRQSALENYELQKAHRKQERLNELHDLKLEYSKRIQNDLNRSNNSSRNSSSSAGGGISRPILKPSTLRPYKTDESFTM